MGAVIEVESLTKRYGATVAVDDLSFSVSRASIVGFLGPNGSGKTTTRPPAGRAGQRRR